MIFDKLVILVGWLYWWSAPTLVGEPSCSPNKVGRGTGTPGVVYHVLFAEALGTLVGA
jgi:hypothetical protein